ncbi:MAG TPA: serine/threonine-protein kinase [Ktedonobacteraceae bacterium]|nr:serine/threonine-protein kinase [Ktedonobacteraceae bacterium]
MANNYPFEQKNPSSMNNPDLPQNGPGGYGAATPQPPAGSERPLPVTPDGRNVGNGGNLRRLAPGTLLSSARYKVEKLVAAGGMGAVYRAIDTRFDSPCAVKEMLDEFQTEVEHNQAVEWFSREAKLLLTLNHPCIPRVRDFFVENGKHYLVMDFIEGRTLGDALEQEGNVAGVNGARGVPEARARSWAQQLCNVLAYLHKQNPPIIFRDLKPSNIMVTTHDEIKLIDFGIARPFKSQQQATIIMTVGYAPPEQLHGRPEPRSDIYALGATLHKVLTRHDAANNQPGIFSFPALRTLRPDITPAFDQIVMKALAPSLEQRWSGALEMERALLTLPPITNTPPTNSGTPVQGGRPSNPLTPNIGVSTPGSGPKGAPITAGTTGPAGPHIIAAIDHLAARRIEPAYEAAKRAFGLEPNNALVHKCFGQVFARRVPPQADLAMQAYNRSLQLNTDDAETHKLVGDISLFLRNQPLQAIPAYRQSLRLNPNDFESHLRLGQCYEKTNQLELALREYQEATRLAPKQPPQPVAFYTLGQLAMRMNQWSTAEQALIQVLIINPADHQTRFLLSQAYEHQNKLEEAFRECGYVVGPLSPNTAVQAMYQRLRTRLGR